MEIIAVDGILLATYGARGSVSDQAARSAPIQAETEYQDILGAPPARLGRSPKPREIKIPINPLEGSEASWDRDAVAALFRVDEDRAVLLTAERQDATEVEVSADVKEIVILPHGLVVTLTLPDFVWRLPDTAVTEVEKTITAIDLDETMRVAVAGQVTTKPIIRLTPTAVRSTSSALFGWSLRKLISITNNSPEPWYNRPMQMPLGDTNALVDAGKALSTGEDFRVRHQGDEWQRTFSEASWNTGATFVWVIIPYLQVGETITLELVYGNPDATTAPVLTYPNITPIDMRGDAGTADGTSTTSSLDDSAKTWDTNIWQTGRVYLVAGTGAPDNRLILSNDANSIVPTSAFAVAPDATTEYVIVMSDNTRWFWPVAQTARNAGMGMWYLSHGTTPPARVDFNVPGAWRPHKRLDNNDAFNQLRWNDYSASGTKYQARFQAVRYRGRNGAQFLSDQGLFDGVFLHSPVRILTLGADFVVTNLEAPDTNATGLFKIETKPHGGEPFWQQQFADGAVHATPTDIVDATYTFAGGVNHIAFSVQPFNEVEIPQELPQDLFVGATTDEILYVTFQTTDYTISALGAEEEIHDLRGAIRLNSGPAATALPHYGLAIGGAGDSGLVHIPVDNSLIIDGEEMTAEEWNSTLTTKIGNRDYAVAFTESHLVDGTAVTEPTEDWLPMRPKSNPVVNPDFTTDVTTGWTTGDTTAGVTIAWSRQTTVFANGGLRGNITANVAAAGAQAYYTTSPSPASARYPVVPGRYYSASADVHTADADLLPFVVLFWYNAAGSLISSVPGDNWTPAINTIYRRAVTAQAPATAVTAHVGVLIHDAAGGTTGAVQFDNVSFDENMLFLEDIDEAMEIGTTIKPGFL